MSIYVAFEKPKTVREFLKELFSYRPYRYEVKNQRTFRDEKCTQLQCYEGKYRSFDDVLECVQTYFPTVNYKTLFRILLTLDIKDREGHQCNLSMGNCIDIRRIRLHYYTGSCAEYSQAHLFSKYNSKYSWLELLHAIGIRSNKEFYDLIRNKK